MVSLVQHINDVSINQNVLPIIKFDPRTDEVIKGRVIEIAEDTTTKENVEPYYQLVIEFSDISAKPFEIWFN